MGTHKKNDARNLKIVGFYCENNTLQAVGERFGLTRESVRLILNKVGISTKIRKRTPPKQPFRKTRLTSKEKFWSLIDKNDDENKCWLWKRKVDQGGYGRMFFLGKEKYSHHLAWYFTYGKYASQWVLHDCGNAACCNPKHLKDGTPKENAADRIRHGRNNGGGKKGQNHGRARLTDSQVKEIKLTLAAKLISHAEIGRQNDVSKSTISSIAGNHTWQHIKI